MLWAYFSFSQFLIIWAGNLPEEIPYFYNRFSGGWQYVSLVILLGHFALPFALLLSRDLKRRPNLLAQVAVAILVMRVVDLIWHVEPMFQHARGSRFTGWTWRCRSAWRASGSSSSRATCGAARCCRSTIRFSRRRSRMTPTDRGPLTRRITTPTPRCTTRTSRTRTADVNIRTVLRVRRRA